MTIKRYELDACEADSCSGGCALHPGCGGRLPARGSRLAALTEAEHGRRIRREQRLHAGGAGATVDGIIDQALFFGDMSEGHLRLVERFTGRKLTHLREAIAERKGKP